MRLSMALSLFLLTTSAHATPVQKGLTVADFFSRFEKEAKDLDEGGMIFNRIRCNADGTTCGGYYGSANMVVAQGLEGGEMDRVIVTQIEPGERQDFWLATALVMDILDGDFRTIPERSNMILDAMLGPTGTAIDGDVCHYIFGRSDTGLAQVIVTAK